MRDAGCAAGGRFEQANIATYQVRRVREALLIEVHIVQSSKPDGREGEPGTSALVPAVANATFAATDKRSGSCRSTPRPSGSSRVDGPPRAAPPAHQRAISPLASSLSSPGAQRFQSGGRRAVCDLLSEPCRLSKQTYLFGRWARPTHAAPVWDRKPTSRPRSRSFKRLAAV